MPRKPQIPKSLALRSVDASEIAEGFSLDRVRVTTEDWGHCVIDSLRLDQVVLERVSFQRCAGRNGQILDTQFESCDLANVSLIESEIVRSEFRKCRMTGFFAGETSFYDVFFDECRLDLCNLRLAKLKSVRFSKCDLRGADFTGAELDIVQFDECDLKGALFARAQLSKVDLRGSAVSELASAEGLAGAIIDPLQAIDLAPLMAQALGITIEDR